MNNPKEFHWEVALHVVIYVKNSPGQGILLQANAELSLSEKCDSDWEACPNKYV